MNPEWKAKWVAALRSGEYKQTREFLRTSTGFCCLGVLCDLVDPSGWRAPVIARVGPLAGTSADVYPYAVEGSATGTTGFMPQNIAQRVGLPFDRVHVLARLNDVERYSFDQIADFIINEIASDEAAATPSAV